MSLASPGGPTDPGLGAVLDALDADRRSRRTVMSTSADRAARAVREEVVEGRLRSGTRLPEERLSAAIGVSRNTLREALSRLVAERILVREPNRGVVVATPDADAVLDVYRARQLIEPAALARGTAHTPERLAAVQAAVDEGRRAAAQGDGDGVASANQHFHRAVVALAGSPRLDDQMELLLAEMRLFFAQTSDPSPFHLPYLEQNAAIAARLETGDRSGAALDLEAYLSRACEHMVGALTSGA